jgi:hypothetical protein
MKHRFLPLFCSIVMLTACATFEKNLTIEGDAKWSTSDPLSIPHETRRKQFEKGNLVVNPSFEEGQVVPKDPANPFKLVGWEKVGQHIEWIQQAPGTDAVRQVHQGRHSIKIARRQASEIDDAEGIISDYIPVIPGNYDFTYAIRLKNITSNRYRLGVQLYDAIVIQVLFYDERKQPIDAGYLNPVSGGLIDNSDKSYSYSNFWQIEDFPWGRVRGRSYNYPFSEGDIPDRTRYVRLFFGLKGTGTLWLDDIYYGFSKWNFTALERFSPFFDKQRPLADSILPTPKHVQEIDDIVYYDAGNPQSHLPVIIIPERPAPAERSAAIVLQQKISEMLAKTIAAGSVEDENGSKTILLANDVDLSDRSGSKLVISIGRNALYQKFLPDLPLAAIGDNQQGYVIKTEKIGSNQVLFLMGVTPVGSYNAATTALQLFENDKFVYHNATVVDYPDFLSRAYVFKNWQTEEELRSDLDAVGRMSRYKLNTAYFGYNRKKPDWYNPDAVYRKGLDQAGRLFKKSGVMHLAIMVNPYAHFEMEMPEKRLDDGLRYTWTHSDPQSFKRLTNVCKIGLDAGADTLMLLADDFVPHIGASRQNYALYTVEDRQHFVNLQNAQAHTINRLKKWIDRSYPGTRLEFCPPWYSNEHIDRSDGKAEIYFRELTSQIPEDVAIIWTGPTIRSLSIDMIDLHRYRSLIGRWPMIWDNTTYARNIESTRYGGYTTYYPGKVRMCNLFEPYDTYKPENFHQLNDSRQMYVNGSAYLETRKLKYATVADYAWNTAAYNPERSLWNILCQTYGQACAQQLIRFSDAYYHLYGICMGMESRGAQESSVERGNIVLAGMDRLLTDIALEAPHKKALLNELEQYRDKQKIRFEKLSQHVAAKGSLSES